MVMFNSKGEKTWSLTVMVIEKVMFDFPVFLFEVNLLQQEKPIYHIMYFILKITCMQVKEMKTVKMQNNKSVIIQLEYLKD